MKVKAYHTSLACPKCGMVMFAHHVKDDMRPRLYCQKGGPSWPGAYACELYQKQFLAPEYELELLPDESVKS
jgi:ribosomal protein S27AE